MLQHRGLRGSFGRSRVAFPGWLSPNLRGGTELGAGWSCISSTQRSRWFPPWRWIVLDGGFICAGTLRTCHMCLPESGLDISTTSVSVLYSQTQIFSAEVSTKSDWRLPERRDLPTLTQILLQKKKKKYKSFFKKKQKTHKSYFAFPIPIFRRKMINVLLIAIISLRYWKCEILSGRLWTLSHLAKAYKQAVTCSNSRKIKTDRKRRQKRAPPRPHTSAKRNSADLKSPHFHPETGKTTTPGAVYQTPQSWAPGQQSL